MASARHDLCVKNFLEWRNASRPLLIAGVPAQQIEWLDARSSACSGSRPLAADETGGDGNMIEAAVPRETAVGNAAKQGAARAGTFRLPRSIMRTLEHVAQYRHPGRWELMYRLAWRALREDSHVFDDAADADVRSAVMMERAVNRECHKMHAFVRFREVQDDRGGLSYFAWFEPEHDILQRGAQFFVKRFPNMNWTIATPDGAAVWEDRELRFIDSPNAGCRPREDSHEQLWRTYYRSICNVARINPRLMQREMPQRYWRHLPEATEIGALVRHGTADFAKRHRQNADTNEKPPKAVRRSLADLPLPGEGPQECRRCDLWKNATQAVVGEGPSAARIMLVGEQPGDEEDLRGHPFVGPAGRLLNGLIDEAGLDRGDLFVTNAVKHFKWEPRGKRRLHKRPNSGEIAACNVWLEREIGKVSPAVIVALGATAVRAVTGRTISIESVRHEQLKHGGGALIVCTYHPSAILRSEGDQLEQMRSALIADLKRAKKAAS